jgi:hypothetical protein
VGRDELVAGFARLFLGRTDALGTEEGGCARLYEVAQSPEAWLKKFQCHLDGTADPIGVYPQLDDNTVRWGCVDFDEGDEASWVHAVNLVTVLGQFGIVGWIERSRSKGYHVWVFLQCWMAARGVREALLAACQIAEAPTKEINPKQPELAPGKIGNYVRICYPGALVAPDPKPGARRVVLPNWVQPTLGRPYTVEEFVWGALDCLTGIAELTDLAALYTPPKRKPPIIEPMATPSWGAASDRLKGLAYTIWKDGPLEGMDRSGALWKLANQIREDGNHNYAEALELMRDADVRWGKFVERGDEDELDRMLTKVWA